MPLVSVIIPIYNTEKFLPLCINSVLNQTLTDIEVLLVNDGSTDGSGKICDEYACKDQRIQVIHTLTKESAMHETKDWKPQKENI